MSKQDADGKLEDVVNWMDSKQDITVEFRGKTFWFEYKNSIPKRTKDNIMMRNSEARNIEDLDSAPLRGGDIQVDLLKEYIVDSSIDHLSTFLKKAPDQIMDPLVEEIIEGNQGDDTEGN